MGWWWARLLPALDVLAQGTKQEFASSDDDGCTTYQSSSYRKAALVQGFAPWFSLTFTSSCLSLYDMVLPFRSGCTAFVLDPGLWPPSNQFWNPSQLSVLSKQPPRLSLLHRFSSGEIK